jgi:hypothetical protein
LPNAALPLTSLSVFLPLEWGTAAYCKADAAVA